MSSLSDKMLKGLMILIIIILIKKIFYFSKNKKVSIEKVDSDSFFKLKNIINEYQEKNIKFGIVVILVENIFEILNLIGHGKLQLILNHIIGYFGKLKPSKYIYINSYSFVFFFPNYENKDIEEFINKIINYLNKNFLIIDGISICLKANIGWALSHEGKTEEIIEKAYSRLDLHQKKETKGTLLEFCNFNITRLIFEFKKALERDEFYLVYQPKFDLSSNTIKGVEALIRWKHQFYGEIPPLDYIPYLEKTNYINDLTFWILKAVIVDIQNLEEQGINVKVSINICPRNILDENFVKRIIAFLKMNMPFSRKLVFEITETDFISNLNKAKEALKNFNKEKIEIHIDDFGTGYSSLVYLREFPIDYLKIDKTFILNLDKEEMNRKIVKTTIEMAHLLGKKVIAEGVETKEVFETLKEMKCNEIQGYYISRPLKKIDLEKFIKDK